MLLKQVLLKESSTDVWEKYYPDTEQKSHTVPNSFISISSSFFLLSSNFQGLSSGVISCSTDNIKFLHSLCSFINNSNTIDGGIIHFSCNSSIVQDRFCSINSYTPNKGQHSYITVNSSDQICFLIESTIFACGKDENCISSIVHFNGINKLLDTNLSKCICEVYTAYSFVRTEAMIKHCYFNGNNVSNNGICFYHNIVQKTNITSSFFIGNQAYVSSSYGLVFVETGHILVISSIFTRNVASFTFADFINGTITVIDCYGSNITKSGSVDTKDMSTESFSLIFIVDPNVGYGFTENIEQLNSNYNKTIEYNNPKKKKLVFACALAGINNR